MLAIARGVNGWQSNLLGLPDPLSFAFSFFLRSCWPRALRLESSSQNGRSAMARSSRMAHTGGERGVDFSFEFERAPWSTGVVTDELARGVAQHVERKRA